VANYDPSAFQRSTQRGKLQTSTWVGYYEFVIFTGAKSGGADEGCSEFISSAVAALGLPRAKQNLIGRQWRRASRKVVKPFGQMG
jgi:hypothetical protein